MSEEQRKCPVSTMEDELIPGLPLGDEVLAKLPISTLYRVCSVNKSWHRAITSGEIYRTRQREGRKDSYLVTALGTFNQGQNIVFRQWLYVFDPRGKIWSLLPPIPGIEEGAPMQGRFCFASGKLVVIGGLSTSLNRWEQSKTTYVLDIGTCQSRWTRGADLLCRREAFACHGIGDKIYICGGIDPSMEKKRQRVRSAHAYDVKKNVWEPVADMQNYYAWHELGKIDGKLYIAKGMVHRNEDFERFESVLDYDQTEAYDPEVDTWTSVPKLIYDPEVDTWTSVPNLIYDPEVDTWTSDLKLVLDPLGPQQLFVFIVNRDKTPTSGGHVINSLHCQTLLRSLRTNTWCFLPLIGSQIYMDAIFAIDFDGGVFVWIWNHSQKNFNFVRVCFRDGDFYKVNCPETFLDTSLTLLRSSLVNIRMDF